MPDRSHAHLALVLLGAWAFCIAVFAGTLAIVAADMAPDERATAAGMAAEHVVPAGIIATLLLLPAGFVLHALFRRYEVALRQLSEDVRVMLVANPGHRAGLRGAHAVRRLAADCNDLAAARQALQQNVTARIAEANLKLEQERNRLAALMSELAQSVIVCNIEGRILLYNARAMDLLRTTPPDTATADGATSLVGLGRSIFGIFERSVISHALDSLRDRLRATPQSATATFVATTAAGQLARVTIAPVGAGMAPGDVDPTADGGDGMAGFVLLLDDITRITEAGRRRDVLLQSLTQGTRASLGSIRAAVETIVAFPDMDGDTHARLIGVIGEEARALTARLDATVSDFADAFQREWPLESMRGADLVAAARRRIERLAGLPTKEEHVDPGIWLEVDSYSLLQGIVYLARRLAEELGIREVRFNLQAKGPLAELDVIWTGAPIGSETTMAWQTDPLSHGGEASPLTLRDIIERHNGEIWYQIDKAAHRECFRIAIPLARPDASAAAPARPAGARPEFYDFDLFAQPGQSPELDARPLATLTFTVFDTETTGLDPGGGDEIVSIGAVRIVNARLLRQEVFAQHLDPQRPMSPEAQAITGIADGMLRGKPLAGEVLPGFARFCEDTVLVAHNAAFDMRFLHLKEAATGVRFTQPVLDTLLLSAVLHPHLDAHQLEVLAERMGVPAVGRHTALGDAIMTGEVFLRMIPLLADRGIHTLGQARAASQQTYLARLRY